MKRYVIRNPTIDGQPAGPDLDNYLEFDEGDVVELVHDDDRPRQVLVRLVDDESGLDQWIDETSLEEL